MARLGLQVNVVGQSSRSSAKNCVLTSRPGDLALRSRSKVMGQGRISGTQQLILGTRVRLLPRAVRFPVILKGNSRVEETINN